MSGRKFALVTGASGGIGSAVARRLAADGFSLYLHYNQNRQAIDDVLVELSQLGCAAVKVQADLSLTDGARRLLAQINDPIDVIVHNSGSSFVGLLTDMSDEQVRDFVQLHVTSPVLLTKQLLAGMIHRKSGKIVVVSSVWGRVGASTEVLYSTVKGALDSFVKSLAKEVAPSGLSVNGIAPGAVDTKMLDHLTEAEKQSLKDEIPMGRFAAPDEIADLAAFLVSEKAAYINGEIVTIDGAWQ
ncbi:MAG TPA: SDR family oxidoreductase [Bacillales bacterium]|nr:SDR family oxidoreductase [Bacillales bacterium]